MKQIIRLYTLVVMSCLLLAGCNSDEDVGDLGNLVAVQFGMGEISNLKTSSGGDQWALNDPVGIFMIKNGQALSTASISEGADNRQYQAQTGGSYVSGFTPVGTNTIYYPQDGSNVDFVAYYPYTTSLINYTYPVNVSNQASPADIDVLYSNNTTGCNKNSGTVDLLFSHALSKLSFTLTSGNGSPSLAGAKIQITNLATTAEINLADGTVAASNSGKTLTANTSTDGLSSSAIVIPQTLSGAKLIITLADNVSVFEWTFTNTQFEQSKNHQYTITVSKTGISVSSSGITTWTGTGDPATPGTAGTLTQYKVGDYYPDPTNSGTAIGIVFWLDPSAWGYDDGSSSGGVVTGYFGKIVSSESPSGMSWGPYNIVTGAISDTDGLWNMAIITAIMNWKTDYPIFAWVDSKNASGTTYSSGLTGIWYLPAKDELATLRNSNLVSFPNYRWSSTENTLNTTQAWSRDVISADPNHKGWGYKAYAILKF